MQKLLALAVVAVIMAVSVNGTDEQLWLNEIAFQEAEEADEEENPEAKEDPPVKRISLEIAMRPAEEEVFEDGEVILSSTSVTAQFYTAEEYLCPVTDEEPNMVSDDCPQKPDSLCAQLITVARPRVAENPWNGTWFGSETFTFKCPVTAIGAVKLTSGLSSATRVYCWGSTNLGDEVIGPDREKCDVAVDGLTDQAVGRDEAQVVKPVVQDDDDDKPMELKPVSYAMVNDGDHWGVKEGDFKWVKYEDGDEKQLMSLDVPNNCTSGSDCDGSIVQTLGYFAFASSIKSSFAVVMGASLATLFTVSIEMA